MSEGDAGPVAILGATGAVGRVALDRLLAAGTTRLRLGARDRRRLAALREQVEAPGREIDTVAVDLDDSGGDAALSAFCHDAAVVLQCAGPSYRVLDRVARVAAAAGAASVDAAGDAVALDALHGPGARPAPGLTENPAVFSAGVMPGLTGLVPRLLGGGDPARIDVFVGGATVIGPVSAIDALLTRGPRFGTAHAAWRAGAVAPAALRPLRGVTLPGFGAPVHAWPFLSEEIRTVAAALTVDELRAYTVYVSDELPQAFAAAWAAEESAGPEAATAGEHVAAVAAAADRDVAAYGADYTLLAQSRPRAGSGLPGERVLLRTPDPYALSGVVVALAARDVLAGRVGPGAARAATALDPAHVLERLAGDPLVTTLDRPAVPVESP